VDDLERGYGIILEIHHYTRTTLVHSCADFVHPGAVNPRPSRNFTETGPFEIDNKSVGTPYNASLVLTYDARVGDQNPLSFGVPFDLIELAGGGGPVWRTDDRNKQNT
jgi:hypothetical protein